MGRPLQTAIECIPKPEISEMVTSLSELHAMGPCRTNAELRQRIDDYFRFCQGSSIRPGIESLCLSLGITRMTLLRWSRGEGCDQERQEIAQAARQMVVAYIECAGLSGRLNPATQIFLLKNWANYRDVVSIESEEYRPQKPTMTPEEIAAKIEKDIPLPDLD